MTSYDPSFPELAHKFCLLGATNKVLAEYFEVSETTIADWMRDRPEFRESVLNGRAVADAAVAASLYKRAVGYSHVQKHINRKGDLVQVKVDVPGDVGAQIFWLCARQRDLWRKTDDNQALPEGGKLAPIGSAEVVEAARRIAFILARAAYQDNSVTTIEVKGDTK